MNVELESRTVAGEWTELLRCQAAQEHEAAFSSLVERQSRFVFRIAYAVLRNVEDSEDLVQETFLKLFRTGVWTQIEDERGYLARMGWRQAVRRKPSKRFLQESETTAIVSNQNSPERAAIETERSRRIHRVIDALPEKLRRPLALSSIQDMTTPEIAAIMSLPEGTVRRLLVEARALVKEKVLRLEGSSDA